MQEEKKADAGQAPCKQPPAQPQSRQRRNKDGKTKTTGSGTPRKKGGKSTSSRSTTAKRKSPESAEAASGVSQDETERPAVVSLTPDSCPAEHTAPSRPSPSDSDAPRQDTPVSCVIFPTGNTYPAKTVQAEPDAPEKEAAATEDSPSKTALFPAGAPTGSTQTFSSVPGQTPLSFPAQAKIHSPQTKDHLTQAVPLKKGDGTAADRRRAAAESERVQDSHAVPTYAALCAELEDLCYRNPEFLPGRIGTSLLGREIPIVSIGTGEKTVLYIGGHHASEWITVTVLLRFCRELANFARGNGRIFGIDRQYYLSSRRLVILPNLNPDGTELALLGLSSAGVLAERPERQNGSPDFSHWKANARGVDLNHNYAAGFSEYKVLERQKGITGGCPSGFSGEYPESEPEVSALCNWIRCVQPAAVLTLHTQGEEIYASSCGKTAPHHAALAKSMERMTGYRFAEPEGGAAYGGLTDWFISEFRKPSFTLECGKGETPLPLSDWFSIYLRLRTLLFRFPYLV